MKLIGFALALFVLMTLPIASAELTGVVADPTGARIAGASLVMRWDPTGSSVGLKTNQGMATDLQIKTDRSGHFRVEAPPGFYDVFVTSSAFSPSCVKVRLRNGATTKHEFKLKLDPLVTAELGDDLNVPVKK